MLLIQYIWIPAVLAYQGRHGLIGPITLHSAKKTANIIEFLEDSLKQIEDARYDVVDKSDMSLQQLIDNIIEIYLRTLYKLKYLAWPFLSRIPRPQMARLALRALLLGMQITR